MQLRLQKYLAHAGVASRRAAERMIEEGRVTVNGTVVRRLGTKVDTDRDAVKIDGKAVARPSGAHVYWMVHKPKGYVTTLSDPEGRPTIADLARSVRARVYPVGRLDFHSEGLVLLTDDGDLARDLMHPSHGVAKTYLVKVKGQPTRDALKRVEGGVSLEGRRTKPARFRTVRPGRNTWLEVVVTEGRKHLIRKLMASVGHRVLKLKRVAYGGVELGDLPAGKGRPLSSGEIELLRRSTRPSGGRRPAEDRDAKRSRRRPDPA